MSQSELTKQAPSSTGTTTSSPRTFQDELQLLVETMIGQGKTAGEIETALDAKQHQLAAHGSFRASMGPSNGHIPQSPSDLFK